MTYERTRAAGQSDLALLRRSLREEFPEAGPAETDHLLKTWLDNGETWRRREPTPPHVLEERMARMCPIVREAAGLPPR